MKRHRAASYRSYSIVLSPGILTGARTECLLLYQQLDLPGRELCQLLLEHIRLLRRQKDCQHHVSSKVSIGNDTALPLHQQLHPLVLGISAGDGQRSPQAHTADSRLVESQFSGTSVGPGQPTGSQQNTTEIPGHHTADIGDLLPDEYIEHGLPRRSLGLPVIAVADHAALFDYGFSACTLAAEVQTGETVGSLPVSGSLLPLVPVQAAEDLSWPLLEGETLETELELTQTSLTAPAAAGTQVGVLRGYVNGVQVGVVPLVCAAAVPRDLAEPQNPLQRLLGWLWN